MIGQPSFVGASDTASAAHALLFQTAHAAGPLWSERPIQGSYLCGLALDVAACLFLLWAFGRTYPWTVRLAWAGSLFVCLQIFGGWQREPKELAFSVSVILCNLALGAHARSAAASAGRHRALAQSAVWVEYWCRQVTAWLRQTAFGTVAVLAAVALLAVETLFIMRG